MLSRRPVALMLALPAALAGLTPACSPPPAGDALRAPTAGEAFGGVVCSAVRPQTEPDLMAWDSGSRSNLNRLRRKGVVAVRYEAKGCNVELELLSNCIAQGAAYEFSPYSANERKLARNANELFAQLPVGAARLSGSLRGDRVLRTDYMLAGQYALPPGTTLRASELKGDCARATHAVSAVYVGAFAMGAGESRVIEGGASLLGAGGGLQSSAAVESLGDEGDAEACKTSQKDRVANDGCAVPLRIALIALDRAAAAAARAPSCPAGTEWDGAQCLGKKVDCPAGTTWDGARCAGTASCAAGAHFEAGRGCVGDAVAAAAVSPPSRPSPAPAGGEASMVSLPAGSFLMGSSDGAANEKPVHRVSVAAFAMDVTEVTTAAYTACVRAGRCTAAGTGEICNYGRSGKDNHPINCVDWDQATAYCASVGKRLPTEEEWEYGARGTDGRRYPWGNEEPGARACWAQRAARSTCSVGSYASGVFGLKDMAGNVYEWTASGYSDDYTRNRVDADRVSRGGGWDGAFAPNLRSSNRHAIPPSSRLGDVGFRCVR